MAVGFLEVLNAVREVDEIGFVVRPLSPGQRYETELRRVMNCRKEKFFVLEAMQTHECFCLDQTPKKTFVVSSLAIPDGTIHPTLPCDPVSSRFSSAKRV